MSLFKFIFYSLIAYLAIRFIMRIISPPKPARPRTQQNDTRPKADAESLEKPKFTIEAESVEYEIIEEPKDKDEK